MINLMKRKKKVVVKKIQQATLSQAFLVADLDNQKKVKEIRGQGALSALVGRKMGPIAAQVSRKKEGKRESVVMEPIKCTTTQALNTHESFTTRNINTCAASV